jgi:nucleoredoxin
MSLTSAFLPMKERAPPSREETGSLPVKQAKTYAAIGAKREDLEFAFVSGDRNEKSFKDYFAQMPWLAPPFNEECYGALSSQLEVEGIPTLVVLDPQDTVITTKGKEATSSDPEGTDFHWRS